MTPSYINLHKSGIFAERIKRAYALMEDCTLCPRKCHINRLTGETGYCKAGLNPAVYSYFLHHGEEPPVSGNRGSGTIFFTHCNMRCVYCQNYNFSQGGEGREVDIVTLAGFMTELKDKGAHNINLVTPAHFIPQILSALDIAIKDGLNIPVVYNTSGYESKEVLELLDGVVDIYLADMRYYNDTFAERYSDAPGYRAINQSAVIEMYRQVGKAELGGSGIIEKGLIIRHLVLPKDISGTRDILLFLRDHISTDCAISLMSQYLPCHKAAEFLEIGRKITAEEYRYAADAMNELGFENGWVQELYGTDEDMAGFNF